jgi:hypothetical protein
MPPTALDRLNEDTPLELHQAPFLEDAIRAGLAINTKERTQSAREFLEAFTAGNTATEQHETNKNEVIYASHGFSITGKEVILPDSRFEFTDIKGFRVQESDPRNQNSAGGPSLKWSLPMFGIVSIAASILLFFVGTLVSFLAFLQLFALLPLFLGVASLGVQHFIEQNTTPASYSARIILITKASPSRNAMQIELLTTASPFETQRLEQALDQVLPRLT